MQEPEQAGYHPGREREGGGSPFHESMLVNEALPSLPPTHRNPPPSTPNSGKLHKLSIYIAVFISITYAICTSYIVQSCKFAVL